MEFMAAQKNAHPLQSITHCSSLDSALIHKQRRISGSSKIHGEQTGVKKASERLRGEEIHVESLHVQRFRVGSLTRGSNQGEVFSRFFMIQQQQALDVLMEAQLDFIFQKVMVQEQTKLSYFSKEVDGAMG